MNKGDNDAFAVGFSESKSVAKTHRRALLVLHSVALNRPGNFWLWMVLVVGCIGIAVFLARKIAS
jgi:hypothetical protein